MTPEEFAKAFSHCIDASMFGPKPFFQQETPEPPREIFVPCEVIEKGDNHADESSKSMVT